MGKLKDSIPLLPSANPDRPFWVQPDVTPRGESFKQSLEAPAEIELRYSPNRTRAADVGKLKAQKFGDLLAQGVKPSAAAHQLHTTVNKMMEKPEVQKRTKELIETFHQDAGVRKLLVRALVNKGMVENSGEGGDPKLLTEYLKMAAKDSELGIDAAPQVNNNTFVMDPGLREILDRTVPVPELPEGEKL